MTILQIAYKNQRDPQTASYSPDDCGPTCLAMLLATTGHDVTVNSMYMNPSSPIRGNRGDLYITDLVKLGTAYGLPIQIRSFTLDTLRQSIDAGKPVICLIFYGPVVQAGLNCVPCLQNGNWGHYVVAVGYDTTYFYVHDPYCDGNMGAYKKWPIALFNHVFMDHLGQFTPGQGLVPVSATFLPTQPAAPAFPVDDQTMRRIRAKALFEQTPVPQINNQNDLNNALVWLGEWGHYAEAYYLQPGDTLPMLCAQRFGSTNFAAGLAAYNGLTDPNSITAGQKILYPLPQPPGAQTPPQPAPAGVPPAMPAPASVAYAFTNQQFINAMAAVYKSRGMVGNEFWQAIVAAGLAQIANFRAAQYNGPAISALPGVPDYIKQMVAQTLGVAYP